MKLSVALVCLAAVLPLAARADSATVVYVAPTGNDGNTGASQEAGRTGPVATLDRALARVRELRKSSGAGVFKIELLAGTYFVDKPIQLGADDSGPAGVPLVIEGPDRSKVVLTGSRALPAPVPPDPSILSRIPAAMRSKVKVYDLTNPALAGWVGLAERGIGYTLPTSTFPSELIVAGQPAPLARWPGEGYARIDKVSLDRQPARVALVPPPPSNWARPLAAWAFGYWGNDWADALLHVTLDTDQMLSVGSKLPPHGIRAGQRAYLTNLPEALDAPGSWFLDSAGSKIYVLPAADGSAQPMELSLTQDLFVLDGVRNVIIRKLTLQNSRRHLVAAKDVQSVVVENCVLKNAGYTAATFSSALRSGVRYCDVLNPGASGIVLAGGDRRTLTASENFADDDRIENFGRTYPTYQPAIRAAGVGARIEHNLIHHGPHSAILFGGNDHHIAFNEIYDVVTDTRDAGAIYCGRDWAGRGTIIEGNFLHDIHGYQGTQAVGVYLDDQASGIAVRKNLFVRVAMGVLVGGGLDNVVENNLFVSSSPAVHIDQRGMTTQKATSNDPNGELQKNLRAVPFDSQAFRARYPTLADVLKDGPGIPRRNTIRNNLAVNGVVSDIQLSAEVAKFQTVGPNWATNDQASVWGHSIDLRSARKAADFSLAGRSPWIEQGFERLDLGQVGPR